MSLFDNKQLRAMGLMNSGLGMLQSGGLRTANGASAIAGGSVNPGAGFRDIMDATQQASWMNSLQQRRRPQIQGAGPPQVTQSPGPGGAGGVRGAGQWTTGGALGSPGDMSWANLPTITQVQGMGPQPTTPPPATPPAAAPPGTAAAAGMTYVPGAGMLPAAAIQAALQGQGQYQQQRGQGQSASWPSFAKMRSDLGFGR